MDQILFITIVVFIVFYCENRENYGVHEPDKIKSLETRMRDDLCDEFMRIPLEIRERSNKIDEMVLLCPQLFLQKYTIGDPRKFLGPKLYMTYQKHLSDKKCTAAQQLLFTKYTSTYAHVPKIDPSQKRDKHRLDWDEMVLRYAPELRFCFAKKIFQSAQKIIDNKQLKTKTLFSLEDAISINISNKVEKDRNGGLWGIYRSMTHDQAPAMIVSLQLVQEGRRLK